MNSQFTRSLRRDNIRLELEISDIQDNLEIELKNLIDLERQLNENKRALSKIKLDS